MIKSSCVVILCAHCSRLTRIGLEKTRNDTNNIYTKPVCVPCGVPQHTNTQIYANIAAATAIEIRSISQVCGCLYILCYELPFRNQSDDDSSPYAVMHARAHTPNLIPVLENNDEKEKS